MMHYTWAEPGDPPSADYASVRAKPLVKPVSYAPLTREIELELIRRYHENGDEKALEWLIGAHRPMVVRMAKHRVRTNGTSLKTLVEYGMLGVRIAAQPPRPSQTKKGKLVGFDVGGPHRFSTYARHYADKEMRAVLADAHPAREAEFENTSAILFEGWAEIKDDGYDLSPGMLASMAHRYQPTCRRSLNLFHPPDWHKPRKKLQPRKTKCTKTELANMDAEYASINERIKHASYAADDAMEGFDEGIERRGRRVALGAEEVKVKLEKETEGWIPFGACITPPRHIMDFSVCLVGKELYGKPFQYIDRKPARFILGNVWRKRKPRRSRWICLRPLASIYYMQGGDDDARSIISLRRYRPSSLWGGRYIWKYTSTV
jgi:hypothetical protein